MGRHKQIADRSGEIELENLTERANVGLIRAHWLHHIVFVASRRRRRTVGFTVHVLLEVHGWLIGWLSGETEGHDKYKSIRLSGRREWVDYLSQLSTAPQRFYLLFPILEDALFSISLIPPTLSIFPGHLHSETNLSHPRTICRGG